MTEAKYKDINLMISEKTYARAKRLLHPSDGDDHMSVAGEFSHTMNVDEFLAMVLEAAIEAIDTKGGQLGYAKCPPETSNNL